MTEYKRRISPEVHAWMKKGATEQARRLRNAYYHHATLTDHQIEEAERAIANAEAERACEICSKAASSSVGSRTCESCGVTFTRLCQECLGKPCPKCKGKLEETNKVFTLSLFRATATVQKRPQMDGEFPDLVCRALAARHSEPGPGPLQGAEDRAKLHRVFARRKFEEARGTKKRILAELDGRGDAVVFHRLLRDQR